MKKLNQFLIYKFKSDRLARYDYQINLTLKEAIMNDELVALGDNHVLRTIRRVLNKEVNFEQIEYLKKLRKKLSKEKNSNENKQKIKEINQFINEKLFIPQYFSVVCTDKRHYQYINTHNLTINGINYQRLLCSASNARNNTAFFIDEKIFDEVNFILKNDAKVKKMVKAKYNAYFALTASSTYEVDTPRVCVVPDYKFKMTKLVDWVTENSPDDTISEEYKELEFNAWDGSGIISPRMASIWGMNMELGYMPSAFCIRNYFIKGMLAVMDFHKFAKEVAGKNTITDLWGKEHNVEELDVILTESQFKLWSCHELRVCLNNSL